MVDAGADQRRDGTAASEPRRRRGRRALRPLELARWAWRQLTSMRTALVLLFLLALAAVPARWCRSAASTRCGPRSSRRSTRRSRRGTTGCRCSTSTPRRGSRRSTCCCSSRWSAACCRAAGRTWARRAPDRRRAAQPRRLPVHRALDDRRDAATRCSTRARRRCARRRFRVDVARRLGRRPRRATCARPATWSSTWRCCCCSSRVALGSLFGFKANVLVVEGDGFSNTLTAYDTCPPGALVRRRRRWRRSPSTLDDLDGALPAERRTSAAHRATSRPRCATPRRPVRRRSRTCCGSTTRWRSTAPRCSCSATATRRCSPCATATGEVVSRGPVPFLPRDGNNTSTGVVKVAGRRRRAARLRGLLPADRGARPAGRPDLGLPRPARCRARCSPPTPATSASTTATPQSVYRLDKTRPDPGDGRGRPAAGAVAGPGATMTLPDGESHHLRRGTAVGLAAGRARPRQAGPALALRGAGAGRPDAVAVRAAPAGLGAGDRRGRRAYARRGRRAGPHRGRGRRGADRRGRRARAIGRVPTRTGGPT